MRSASDDDVVEQITVHLGAPSASAANVTVPFSDDYLGSVHLKEVLETVVSVNNSTVKLVDIRSGKSASVKLNHRTCSTTTFSHS